MFRDLSFSVTAGEAVALTGANGAGKTSLLRAVAGFIAPLAGQIEFEAAGLDAEEARRGHTHLIGHLDGLKTARSARDQLMFQSRWTGGDTAAALDAAARLGIDRLLDLEVRTLSSGQKRRLALARLLAAPRRLWLLDEPMAPLDSAGRQLFGDMLAEHLAGGGLVLAAVHDPLPIAARHIEVAA